jgi:hypothetical protein
MACGGAVGSISKTVEFSDFLLSRQNSGNKAPDSIHLGDLSLYGRPVQPTVLVCMPGDWMR